MDQDEIDRNAADAIGKANFRIRLDVLFEADGIRPIEIPDKAIVHIAALITKRLPPTIPAAEIGFPGRWRLIMRAVQVEAGGRLEG